MDKKYDYLLFLFLIVSLLFPSLSYPYYEELINQNIAWKQFPLRNYWQKQNNLLGGQGMDMIFDIDWNEKDPNILYLVVDTTRVWKSIDRGTSWFPLAQDLKVKGGLSIKSDPNNPDIVFFIGLFHNDSGLESNYDGIYRSIDKGNTWEGPIGNTIHYQRRHAGQLFLIDPDSFQGTQSQIIYVGTPDGVLKSTDGGTSWFNFALKGHDIYDLERSKAIRNYFLASSNYGLYKINTIDGKVTRVGNGLPVHPWDVAISRQDGSIVYAAAGNGVYKSFDGGINFIEKSNGIRRDKNYQRVSLSKFDHNKLIIVPDQAGGDLPYWSSDGAATWNQRETIYLEEMLTGGFYWANPVVFDPENSNIAISETSGSLVKTFDGGKSWHYSGNGFTGGSVNDILFISENSMIFCANDYGLFLTEDGGQSFKDLDIERSYDQKTCTSADMLDNTIIASSGEWAKQDIMLSEDKGNTWQHIKTAGNYFYFIRFNKKNNNIVYADNYISRDKGKTWNSVNDGYEIRAMAPNNNDIVYGIKEIAEKEWQVARSEDAGNTWQVLGSSIQAAGLLEMAVDPNSTAIHILIAAGERGIYQYLNNTWNLLIGDDIGLGPPWDNQEINSVNFDLRNPGIVWAARRGYGKHGDGVYLSKDNGATWTNVINNLGPHNNFFNIAISPYDSTVYLSGPGVWTYSFIPASYNVPSPPTLLMIIK